MVKNTLNQVIQRITGFFKKKSWPQPQRHV